MYRHMGTEPNFKAPVKTDVFITTDERQRKWTNKVRLSTAEQQAKR